MSTASFPDDAGCRGRGDLFVAPASASNTSGQRKWAARVLPEARRICATCPVFQQCADHHDQHGERGVVAAGTMRFGRHGNNSTGWLGGAYRDTRATIGHGSTAAYTRHLRNGERPCEGCAEAHVRSQEHQLRTRRTAS